MAAGWWWPDRRFVIVADRPDVLRLEQVQPAGWGSHQLHSAHGPAISWATDALFFWHGVRVPDDPDVIRGWDMVRVMAERNVEVRRCLIEIVGWDRFMSHLALVAEADDPGNAPHKVGLYELPADMRRLYAEPARLLLVVNGSVERDGTRRRFGLPVPAHHADPIEAAAELYGWPTAAYRQLEIRR